MIDARLLLPAASAWLAAVLVIVGTGLIGDPVERHGIAVILASSGCAVGVALVLAALRLPIRWRPALLSAGFGLALGACSAGAHVWAITPEPVAAWTSARASAGVVAVVNGEPVTRAIGTAAVWQSSSSTEVRIATTMISARGERVLVALPLSLRVDEPGLVPAPGTEIVVSGRLGPATKPDLAGVLTMRSESGLTILRPPGPVDSAASSMREGLRESLAGVGPDAAALVAGLSVGDESLQSAGLDDSMQASGLSHLTAVSGGNVAIILAVVLGIARLLRWRMPTRVIVALAALGYFVILVRPQPSVVRAAVMGVVMVLALLTGGRRSGPAVLATAVLVLVVVSPALAVSWAFGLSVFATGGLILLTPSVAARLARWRITRRWPPALQEGVAVTTAAQLATLPLLVGMGASVGWVAVPANLLAMPAVAPVTILGLIAAMVAPFSLPVAAVIAQVAALPAAWIAWVASACSTLPFAAFPWPSGFMGVILLAIATPLLFVAHRLVRRLYPTGIPRQVMTTGAAVVVLVLTVLSLAPAGRRGWPPAGWLMVACSVGQGDGLIIRDGEGSAVIIDAGPDPALIDACLDDLGVTAVTALILTHFHADHVNGVPGVLRDREVAAVFASPVDDPPEQVAMVLGWLSGIAPAPVAVRVGEIRTTGSVSWRVLWPRRVIRAGSVPNNASVGIVLESAGTTFLFTGDVEAEAQSAIIASEPGLRVDVVKVPHHGSRNLDPRLPAWSGGRIALVSVGEGNTYGHPAPETLDAWAAVGALVGRTDEQGDLAVVRDGDGNLGLVSRGN